jgi:hypothetical protein
MKRAVSILAIAASLAAPGIAFAQDLPPSVDELRLTDIQIREKPVAKYGRRILGTLPSGARVEIDLDGRNAIEDIEARGKELFPVAEIRSLVPAPILGNTSWPTDARLEKIEFESDGRVEIEGRLADGREFEAEFAADGQLLDFDTDD